jgi:hypothetical protein
VAWTRTPGLDKYFWRFNLPALLASAGLFGVESVGGQQTSSSEYFGMRRYSFEAEREGLRVRFESYHYPLEDYVLSLERAGFLIETMREPRPDAAWIGEDPSVAKRLRIPLTLHVRALKPAAGR